MCFNPWYSQGSAHSAFYSAQVSLNLEPLNEAYDSSSSGPTTDISIEGPQVAALTVPSQPRSFSAGSGKESVGSSSGNTPRFEIVGVVLWCWCLVIRAHSLFDNNNVSLCFSFRGKDHLYFQNAQKDKGNEESLENQMPITSTSQHIKTSVNPSCLEPSGQTSSDVLSG